jgi:hypothetical protein
LIAAPNDQSTGAIWGCGGAIPGANSNVLGGGAQNTIDIVAYCPSGGATCCIPNAAAVICSNLTLGGYSDWYLPNVTELRLVNANIGLVNDLGLGDIIGIASGSLYWTSNKGTNNSTAYRFTFSAPGQNAFSTGRTALYRVRVIRAF